MPSNFWILIAVQFLIFVAVAFYHRKKANSFLFIVAMSALFGCFIGILFDTLNINLGIHAYFADNTSATLSSLSLTLPHLLINGAFSYGLAVATVYYITPQTITVLKEEQRASGIAVCVLIVLFSILLITLLPIGTIWIMIVCGILVLALGEFIALLFRKVGPLCGLVYTFEYKPILFLWMYAVGIGFVYEVANFFFPFWIFLPGSEHHYLLIETIVIIFGYGVLIHPMIIFWQLLQRE